MYIKPFFVKGLAHISYLLGAGKQCLIVDPRRDIQVYLDEAEKMGLKITHILETHLHADFISGHLDLAKVTGAKIYGPKSGKMQFPHVPLSENDEFIVEHLKFHILETPGHTPEHIGYVVTDISRGKEPCAFFSGDTLFVGDVGRPDLFPGRADELAEKLFNSLKKIKQLPDFVEVYPAHGAGSLCGKAISAKRSSTIGYEKKYNDALNYNTLEEFKSKLLEKMPAAPDHFKRCSATNQAGPAIIDEMPSVRPLPPVEFRKIMENEDPIVLDIRNTAAFGGQHIPGSISIDIDSNFPTFCGWLLPVDKPILLVADCEGDIDRAILGLHRVGLDNIIGWLYGGIYKWTVQGFPVEMLPQISVQEMKAHCEKKDLAILDARSEKEYKAFHIETAVNMPVEDTRTQFDKVGSNPTLVICNSGHRSTTAASILMNRGVKNVMNLPGGMTAWQAAGYTEKCPYSYNIHGPRV